MKILVVVGFVSLILLFAWLGHQIEKAYIAKYYGKDSAKYLNSRLGDSATAMASGILGFALATLITYLPSLATNC